MSSGDIQGINRACASKLWMHNELLKALLKLVGYTTGVREVVELTRGKLGVDVANLRLKNV